LPISLITENTTLSSRLFHPTPRSTTPSLRLLFELSSPFSFIESISCHPNMFGHTFSAADIPDLKGKVAIVTGANTGIGKVSSIELARSAFFILIFLFFLSISCPCLFSFRHGAHVIMACRSVERARPAVEEAIKLSGNQNVEFLPLDLSSLKSVAAFVEAFKAKNLPLHLLLNNAGVMACPFALTTDGIESQFGTNHIGHFYLTLLLFDLLEQNQPSRIVNVSSSAHNMAPSQGILFDSINDEASYGAWKAYGQSKLANILFTRELARRTEGKQIFINTLHPGVVETDLQRHMGGFSKWLINRVSLTPEKGALTQLYLSAHPDVEKNNIHGEFYVPTAKKSTSSSLSRDQKLAEKLWDFSVALVKEKVGEFAVPDTLQNK